ncbi:MAG: hypothetical protein WA956_07315 [Stenotrophomonas sp.]
MKVWQASSAVMAWKRTLRRSFPFAATAFRASPLHRHVHAQHEERFSISIPRSYCVMQRKTCGPPAARASAHGGISFACPIAKPRESARNESA